jgi:hypothetical protein
VVPPPEVIRLQRALEQAGAVVQPYDGPDFGAYAASLRERLRVLTSPEGEWWHRT